VYKIKVLFLPEEIRHSMHIKQSSSLQYELISLPIGQFTPEMAEKLTSMCQELREQGRSVIIDAHEIIDAAPHALDKLGMWQTAAYEKNTSWVMAGLRKPLWPEEAEIELNLTPTLDEAIDLVAMEIIERELLGDDF
jgi:hypothetical protein